jgi:RecA-family ATPase
MPDGTDRFYLIEDRDGGLESMKAKIEELIIACGCQLIILDPLQDILDGMTNEEQAVFLKWMKGMLKSHDVTFINVNHVRKSGGGQKANSTGADLFEEDMQGSSSIFKSGACNLLFTRNKEAEDEIERNTTRMKASKIRWTGKTGVAGEYFYDNASHTMFDKDDYLAKNGTKEF